MDAWVGALKEGRQPPITGEDGLKVLQIIDSVFDSGRTGAPITLR